MRAVRILMLRDFAFNNLLQPLRFDFSQNQRLDFVPPVLADGENDFITMVATELGNLFDRLLKIGRALLCLYTPPPLAQYGAFLQFLLEEQVSLMDSSTPA